MNLELFIEKVDDGTLTVGEAFEFVENNPGSSTGQKDKAGKLRRNLPFSMDKPYFEVYKTDEFINSVQGPVNRFRDFSSFESGLQKGLIRTETFKKEDYQLLSRGTGVAAKTKEGAGVQDRTLKPMRGTIYSTDLDEMYHRHLQNNSYPVLNKDGEPAIDKKTNAPKRVFISQDTKDYMIYEKATGQRLESNIGKDGIKISDVTVTNRPDGSVIVEIAEKKSATKFRPRIKYEGEFALFLKHLHTKAVARAKKADLKTVDFFNTTPDKVNGVWNHYFRPELESRFSTQLPEGGKATPKVIRKILARILEDEFEVDKGLVDSWIGHAGGQDDASTRLSAKAYAGVVSDKRIGPLINNIIRNDALNTGTSVNDLFVERGSNVLEFKDGNFTYPANKEPYLYSRDVNVVPQKQRRTKQEIVTANQISKTKETKSRLEQLEYDEKVIEQEAINQKKALEVAQQDPAVTKKIAEGKSLQKKAQLEADIAAGLKSPPKKSAKGGIDLSEVFSSEEWKDLTKGLKSIAVATGIFGVASEARSDFLKYKERGYSDIGAGLGAGAETARDVAVDVVTGLNPLRVATDFSLQSSPAGQGSELQAGGDYRTISEDEYANMTSMGLETSKQDMATTNPMNYAMDQQMSDMLRKEVPDPLRITIDGGTVTMPDGSSRPFGSNI